VHKTDKNMMGNRDDCDTCVDCGAAVKSTQQGLKCDGCSFWHHECVGVSDEVYNFLCKHDDESANM